MFGRRAGIRTPIDRFGDGEPTVDRLSYMAGDVGFEPTDSGVKVRGVDRFTNRQYKNKQAHGGDISTTWRELNP